MRLNKAIVLAIFTVVLYSPSIKGQPTDDSDAVRQWKQNLRKYSQLKELVKSLKPRKTQDSLGIISYESADCFMEIKDKPSPLCFSASIYPQNEEISKLSESQIKKLPKEARLKIANKDYISHHILFSGMGSFSEDYYTFFVKPDGTIRSLEYNYIPTVFKGGGLRSAYKIENGKCHISEQLVECSGTIKPLENWVLSYDKDNIGRVITARIKI